MKNNIIRILKQIIKPKSKDENKARQEYVLNILLTAIIFLVFIGIIRISSQLIFYRTANYGNVSLPLFFILGTFIFFVTLYLISHYGHSRISSYIFLTLLFSIATYMGCTWGIDLQAAILFYVLIIIMAGILIGSVPAFITTFITLLTFLSVHYLQVTKIIVADRSWVNESWGYSDIIITSLILFIIAIISWLFNHELEKSFAKIKKSEVELKNERDLLEVRVEEKTKELKIIQAEEIAQVYRFAEFGKLSSGLFHDLVNPLTTVMLNVDKIKIDSENYPSLNFIKAELEQASKASEKMRDFINSVRKQISNREENKIFCLNQEIEDAISVLNYKACKNQVCLIFSAEEKINIFGNPTKFNQIITNLISNAIDSYDNLSYDNKKIEINLEKTNTITLIVKDNGSGKKETDINKIFEPFFTTKIQSDNLGLGLSLIKKFIEEDFSGSIDISSQPNKGTTFKINFPLT